MPLAAAAKPSQRTELAPSPGASACAASTRRSARGLAQSWISTVKAGAAMRKAGGGVQTRLLQFGASLHTALRAAVFGANVRERQKRSCAPSQPRMAACAKRTLPYEQRASRARWWARPLKN
jgi:hypothetical protein